jgi:hypothetical protein
MPVFKPRNRLINFRLSEEEFEQLRTSCSLHGARSLSDFARNAVLRVANGGDRSQPVSDAAPDLRVVALDRKMQDLETRVSDLMQLIEQLRTTGGATPSVAETHRFA